MEPTSAAPRPVLPASFSRPVLPVLIALMTGIVLGSYAPDHPCFLWPAAGLSGLWVLFCTATGRGARNSPLVLIAALGSLSISPYVTTRLPDDHPVRQADSRTRRVITGIVRDEPWSASNERYRFDVNVLGIDPFSTGARAADFPINKHRHRGIVRITVYGGRPDIAKGDRIVLAAKLKPIRNFNNPGGFDYRRYMAFRGVRATANISSVDILSIAKQDAGIFRPDIDGRRARLADWISGRLEGDARAVMKALIVGDRSDISPELRERFNRSGAGHLLAISGLHIGIIAFLAFGTAVRALSFITPLLWNAWPRKIAAVLAMAAAVAYGLLAGMSPSTQRAVIMACLLLSAYVFHRENDSLNSVFTAALMILIVHPPALFSISFQLSFAAVTAIIYGFSKIRTAEQGSPGRLQALLKRLVNFILISALAILGTLPLVMFYFNEMSLIGLVLNVILIPLMGFLGVPAGLLAVVLLPLGETSAAFFLDIGAAAIRAGLAVIEMAVNIPFSHLATFKPTLFEMVLYYGILAALLNLRIGGGITPGNRDPDATPGWNLKALIALILLLAAASGDGLFWWHARLNKTDLRITVLDVGLGNAALLELPKGEIMLIDGGGFSSNRWLDIGENIIAPYLRQKKIMTVDRLVLTHPDSDHLNGLLFIADHFHVREVWTTGEAADTDGYREWMEILAKRGIYQPDWNRLGGSTKTIRNLEFAFLHPPSEVQVRQNTPVRKNANEDSMVLKVIFGETAFLFPGDIERRCERQLVERAGSELKSTVMIAPHHGSNTSSSEPLIKAVAPEIVIFSVDSDNRFGFPHPPVIDRYEKAGVRMIGTHLHGAVTIVSDGKRIRVKTAVGRRHITPLMVKPAG